jgi:hypothetical protein
VKIGLKYHHCKFEISQNVGNNNNSSWLNYTVEISYFRKIGHTKKNCF